MVSPSHAESPPPPLNRQGVLLVAFGTSHPEAIVSYYALETAFREAFPDQPLAWALTSKIIRKKLAEAGRPTESIDQAMTRLSREGVRTLRVQSLHVLAGEEYASMERAVLRHVLQHPDRFDAVYIGRPLLESNEDLEDVTKALLASLAEERRKDEAVVFMAHGHEHGRGDMILQAMANRLQEEDPLVFLATVEGGLDFDEVLESLKRHKVSKVWLHPFLVVAGDHARNDLLGEAEDSWASRIRAEGLQAQGLLFGLGELKGVREVFVRHAKDAEDDITTHKDAE